MTFCAEKLDAGAVRILRKQPTVSVLLAPNLSLRLAEERLCAVSMLGDGVAERSKKSIRPHRPQSKMPKCVTQNGPCGSVAQKTIMLKRLEGELTFCAEKLDAGTVRILRKQPTVSVLLAPDLSLRLAEERLCAASMLATAL